MSITRDIVVALRHFRRRPGLPVVIVLSLGAAMGLSTSLFSVVNALWFTPWPVPAAEQVRVIGAGMTVDEWRAWPRQTQTFSGLAAEHRAGVARLGRQIVRPVAVSANYFQVLGIPMAAGRGFAEDERAGDTAVISHDLWQNRLGGNPDVIGKAVILDRVDRSLPGVPLTIVGIAAEGFGGTDLIGGVHVWLRIDAEQRFDTGAARLMVFGRLAPGVLDTQAAAEISVLARRHAQDQRAAVTAAPIRRTDRYSLAPPSVETGLRWLSFVAGVVFITLIACANVSNLLLARGYARRAEIALRLAIGARRALVIRQILIESLMFSVAAAGVGIAIASWLPEVMFRSVIEDLLDGQLAFPVDRRVFLWSLAISLVACIAFGLVPALRSTDVTLSDALKEGHDNSKRALMPGLLGYQTIVSVMAIVIAGLMLRSGPVAEARRISRAVDGLTVVRLDVPGEVDAARRRTLLETLSERLRLVSGGSVAGMKEEQLRAGVSQTLHVTPTYFEVVRLPWVAGRPFAASDPAGDVMVVNEAFARRFWPTGNALGQLLPSGDDRISDRTLIGRRVIGIVENVQLTEPTAYLPTGPGEVQVLLIRATRDRVARETSALIGGIQPTVAADIRSGSSWVAAVIGPSLLAAWMTSGFGGVALLLGTIGFFSLLEYSVQQRTREIGIRRALGAQSRDILRAIVIPAAGPLVRGLVIGSAGAAVAAVFMQRAQLPSGINPLDAVIYLAVAAILTLAAMAAAYVPARRALRIEPSHALRAE